MAPPARAHAVLSLLLAASFGWLGCEAAAPLALWSIPVVGAGVGVLVWRTSSDPLNRSEQTWTRVTSRHFKLDTDLDPADGRSVALELESWWKALDGVVFAAGPRDDEATAGVLHVVAVRNDWERIHVAGGDLLGFFSELDVVAPFAFVGSPLSREGRQTLKHELVHAFVHQRLPAAPHWLDEGLARYLQTAELDPRAGEVTWGRVNGAEVREYESDLGTPVPEILHPTHLSVRREFLFSLQAALLVHMLMDRHAVEMQCYLTRLAGSHDAKGSFDDCFRATDGWQAEVNEYAFTTLFATRTGACPPGTSVAEVAPLAAAEVHALLALIDIGTVGRSEGDFHEDRRLRIQGNLNKALELDPAEPLASALALSWLDLDPRQQATRSQAAIDEHPQDWRAWLSRARSSGLTDGERVEVCRRVGELAPTGLDGGRILPCHRQGRGDRVGWLPEASIRDGVHGGRGAFEACYRPEANQVSAPNGELAIQFTIGSSGQVDSATAVESALRKPLLEACLVAAMRRLRFPPPIGGALRPRRCRFRFASVSSTAGLSSLGGGTQSVRVDTDLMVEGDRSPS